MYVVVLHRIKDAQTAFARGEKLVKSEGMPPGGAPWRRSSDRRDGQHQRYDPARAAAHLKRKPEPESVRHSSRLYRSPCMARHGV